MHRNAPLTPEGRFRLCQRIEGGWPVAHAAASMGISRDRAYVWWNRYCEDGVAGLQDRSSRPRRSPTKTKATRERRVVTLRRTKGLGPARIAGIVGMPASTVHRVLCRHHLNRLDCLDRVTRAPIRRFEMTRPGELVHVDIKKLGRIPKGGGWRAHGRGRVTPRRHAGGYAFVHSAIDGFSRLAYSEVLNDETGTTAAGFWSRAAEFFATQGFDVERVLTDNGGCYRSRDFAGALVSVKVIRRVLSERQLQHTLGSLRLFGERITNSAPPVETLRPMPLQQTLRRSSQPKRGDALAGIDG